MKKIYFFAAAALALAACSNDDKYADNEPVAARITANIGNSISSRAAGTVWAKGDKIGQSYRCRDKYLYKLYPPIGRHADRRRHGGFYPDGKNYL